MRAVVPIAAFLFVCCMLLLLFVLCCIFLLLVDLSRSHGTLYTYVELYSLEEGVFRILLTLLAEFARCQTLLN